MIRVPQRRAVAWGGRPLVGLLCLPGLLLSAAAWAQQTEEIDLTADGPPPPAAAPSDPPEMGPAPQRRPADPFAAGHIWRSLGLRDLIAVGEVGDALIALDTEGGLYRRPGGGRWELLIGGSQGDAEVDQEEILLDAESAVQDFLEGGEVDAEEEDAPAPDVDDGVQAGIQDAEQRLRDGHASVMGTVWRSPRDPMLAIAAGVRGAWRSTDAGLHWEPLLTLEGASEILDTGLGHGVLLAATESGIRVSADAGLTWFGVVQDLDGVEIYDFAWDGSSLWAATAEGLYASRDGVQWHRSEAAGLPSGRVRSVATDPSTPGSFWVATDSGILRTDDGGKRFVQAGRNPLVGTRRLRTLSRPGHLLASGEDGVWESVDGGVQWSPLSTGLPGPEVAGLAITQDGPVIATRNGAYQLLHRAPEAAKTSSAAATGTTEEVPPFSEVMDVALRRAGVRLDPLSVGRAIAASLLAPKLAINGQLNLGRNRGANIDGLSNDGAYSHDWKIGLTLCFGGCGNTNVSYVDSDTLDISEMEDLGITVVDGQIYEDTTANYSAAGANVGERLSRYRNGLADIVTELYFSRIRLVSERAGLPGLSLRERVEHELEISEVTARLDAYTDGYFSRAVQRP